MAAEVRVEGAPVGLDKIGDALERRPTAFGFFQAVRLLERLFPDRVPVGDFADPSREVVRFGVDPGLAFPPSQIKTLDLEDTHVDGIEDIGRQPRMVVNFMGLVGPSGVLPYEYSLLAIARQRAKDPTMLAFFDIFHHRAISLFYRAWRKYRFTVDYEQGREDRITAHALDLVGLGLQSYRDKLPFPDDALAFYAGLFALQPRGASALEHLVEDFFDVPAVVEQFVGGWYSLPERDQCEIGGEDTSSVLGMGAVVGDEIWDQQARVRIRIGPLPRARFREFLPDGSAYEKLRSLVRFFAHDQFEFELQLVLDREDVPGLVLGDDPAETRLGWSTWIRTVQRAAEADETVLAL
jgi:type VI secretion system protein ImpH